VDSDGRACVAFEGKGRKKTSSDLRFDGAGRAGRTKASWPERRYVQIVSSGKTSVRKGAH